MNWTKTSIPFRALSVGLVCATFFCALYPASGQSASFSLTQPTIVPGTVLDPGSYSISIVDHLSDRVLLHIENAQKSSPVTLIAVPSTAISGARGAVTWPRLADNKTALRGFIFGQGPQLEFVYPKDQAVALAKANGEGVLAVDPASENKPAELASLKKEDMEAVTLWALTPSRVNASSDVSISAARYQPSAGTYRVARSGAPSLPIKRLPHTASSLPLVLLLGVVSFLCASLLFLRRLFGNEA